MGYNIRGWIYPEKSADGKDDVFYSDRLTGMKLGIPAERESVSFSLIFQLPGLGQSRPNHEIGTELNQTIKYLLNNCYSKLILDIMRIKGRGIPH
jgi:hypothetical protein